METLSRTTSTPRHSFWRTVGKGIVLAAYIPGIPGALFGLLWVALLSRLGTTSLQLAVYLVVGCFVVGFILGGIVGGANAIALFLLARVTRITVVKAVLLDAILAAAWGSVFALMPGLDWQNPPGNLMDYAVMLAIFGAWHGWRMARYMNDQVLRGGFRWRPSLLSSLNDSASEEVGDEEKRRRLIVAILLLLLGLLFACVAVEGYRGIKRQQTFEMAGEASGRLRLGMTRSQADQAVGEYAIRYRCSESDLYLFGSTDPHLAGMLVLRYWGEGDGDVVLRRIEGLDVEQVGLFARCAVSS